MFGWLQNKVLSWAVGSQRKEMEEFLSNLRELDDSEVSAVVALAEKANREFMMAYDCRLSDPAEALKTHPGVDQALHRQIKLAQKRGDFASSSALMVWLHTLRGVFSPDVKPLSLEIWAELRRGMGDRPNFPVGFDPSVDVRTAER